jgi:hypothetical protein
MISQKQISKDMVNTGYDLYSKENEVEKEKLLMRFANFYII